MAWYDTFNDVFWLSIAGMIFGFLAALAKCKYQRCSCFGVVIEKGPEEDVNDNQSTAASQEPTPSRDLSLTDFQTGLELTPEPPRTRSKTALIPPKDA